MAIEFYKRYFPEKKLAAFVCSSWIFYPEFEQLLPDSNMSALMRELYLFPILMSTRRHGIFFLFGHDNGDLADYPRDNSVRRAMLKIVDDGKPLRSGGMFILPEDVPGLGQQFYRKSFTCN
jgi:GNAT domain-containint protein